MQRNPRSRTAHRFAPSWSIGLWAWLVLMACAANAQTVVLELRNGDRISGVILTESTNRLVVSNAWSREIVLSPDQILRRSPVAPASVAAGPAPVGPGTNSSPAAPSSGSAKGVVSVVATNAAKAAVQAKAPPHWTGEAAVGLDVMQNTKNRQIYYGRAKIAYANGRVHNLVDVSGSYGETEGLVDANRVDGSNKTDFELDPTWYVYNLASVGYDAVRKIDFRGEIGPGLGLHVSKAPNFILNTEVGFDYLAEDRSDNTYYDHFYMRLSENGAWKINKKFTLEHRLEYFPTFTSLDQFRLRGEATLRYWLWSNLSLNVGVIDAYDTSSASGVPPNDLQVRSSIAFKF
jgi:hypothetical protein